MDSPAWKAELPPFSAGFFANYEFLGVLGEGGMGRVYLARQTKLDREVAIKILKSMGESETQRFEREAMMLAGMSHPRVLRVFDSGTDEGISYLVTERVLAGTLERHIVQAPMKLREALRVCARVADALAYAHSEGIVHRDVKPDNVFLLEDLEIKLGDFGLARQVLGAQLTASGLMMGTPEYMSPEQVSAKPAGPASDQFSLGVMLYRMATQLQPFTGENPVTVAMQRLRIPAPSPRMHCPTLPEPVEEVIMRTLEMQPQNRYPSAEGLRQELDRLADELGPEADRVYRPPVRSTMRQPILDPDAFAEAPPVGTGAGSTAPRRRTRREPAMPASHAPTAVMPVPEGGGTSTWWVLVGLILMLGVGAAAAWRMRAAHQPAKVIVSTPSPEAISDADFAARRLAQAITRLAPMEHLEYLRGEEKRLRPKGERGAAWMKALRAPWLARFEPSLARSLVVDAWGLFVPFKDEYLKSSEVPSPERLTTLNLIEDLSFLCLGLEELGLPVPLDPSPSGVPAAQAPPGRMDGGMGFQLARCGNPDRLELVPHRDATAVIEHVVNAEASPVDDRFSTTDAVTLGGDRITDAIIDGFNKASKRRGGGQTSYLHPRPFTVPNLAQVEALAVAAFVSEMKPKLRFEIYAGTNKNGKLDQRIATFRLKADHRRQVWQPMDPKVLPAASVYLRVKYTTLPGIDPRQDIADLHQLTLHWKNRAP